MVSVSHLAPIHLGLDVHKDTIASAALDPAGGVSAEATFDNTPAGHDALATWITANSIDPRCGLEPPGGVGHAAEDRRSQARRR